MASTRIDKGQALNMVMNEQVNRECMLLNDIFTYSHELCM